MFAVIGRMFSAGCKECRQQRDFGTIRR